MTLIRNIVCQAHLLLLAIIGLLSALKACHSIWKQIKRKKEPKTDEGKKSISKAQRIRTIIMWAALTIVVAFVIWITHTSTEVPQVVGTTLDNAIQTLNEHSLDYRITPDPSLPKSDHVSQQSIEAGQYVEKHTVMELTIGAGPVRRLYGWDGKKYCYVQLGHYPQNAGALEPILWRVLAVNENHALLLSEYVLDARSFDSDNSDWNNSSINAWLNNTFFPEAFPASEVRGCIVSCKKLPKVFLLSKDEYLNTAYGFSSEDDMNDPNRCAHGTSYAQDHGLFVQDTLCSYYTRTAVNSSDLYHVRGHGSIGIARYSRNNVGIRPAILIDPNKISFTLGDGSMNDPLRCE